tara:strand:+ start:16196 stop:18124 length:1929 start_codon:yes stop_codon:yes gene_type:complete
MALNAESLAIIEAHKRTLNPEAKAVVDQWRAQGKAAVAAKEAQLQKNAGRGPGEKLGVGVHYGAKRGLGSMMNLLAEGGISAAQASLDPEARVRQQIATGYDPGAEDYSDMVPDNIGPIPTNDAGFAAARQNFKDQDAGGLGELGAIGSEMALLGPVGSRAAGLQRTAGRLTDPKLLQRVGVPSSLSKLGGVTGSRFARGAVPGATYGVLASPEDRSGGALFGGLTGGSLSQLGMLKKPLTEGFLKTRDASKRLMEASGAHIPVNLSVADPVTGVSGLMPKLYEALKGVPAVGKHIVAQEKSALRAWQTEHESGIMKTLNSKLSEKIKALKDKVLEDDAGNVIQYTAPRQAVDLLKAEFNKLYEPIKKYSLGDLKLKVDDFGESLLGRVDNDAAKNVLGLAFAKFNKLNNPKVKDILELRREMAEKNVSISADIDRILTGRLETLSKAGLHQRALPGSRPAQLNAQMRKDVDDYMKLREPYRQYAVLESAVTKAVDAKRLGRYWPDDVIDASKAPGLSYTTGKERALSAGETGMLALGDKGAISAPDPRFFQIAATLGLGAGTLAGVSDIVGLSDNAFWKTAGGVASLYALSRGLASPGTQKALMGGTNWQQRLADAAKQYPQRFADRARTVTAAATSGVNE